MKKLLAFVLSLVLVFSLAACTGTPEPTPEATKPTEATTPLATVAPTEPTAPPETEPPAPVIAKGTSWNSVEDFHKEADPDSVWQYFFFDPEDSSFNEMQIFIDHDDLNIHSWYPWEGSWVGVGFNNGEFCDTYGQALEQNVDGPTGMRSVIGFIAPADGKYLVTGKLMNAFDQDAGVFTVTREDGTVLIEENYRDYINGGYTFLTPTEITMARGEIIYFVPASENDWVSAYTDFTVYYENEDATLLEKPEGFIPEPEYPETSICVASPLMDALVDLNTEASDGAPWGYAITSDGVNFEPMGQFIPREWDSDPEPDAMEWYTNPDSYVGIGRNADVNEFLEANVSDSFENGGEAAALVFTAQMSGTYSFTVYTKNVYGQNADKIVMVAAGEVICEIPFTTFGNAKTVDFTIPEGMKVYFFGISNGGWVSAYFNVFLNEFSAVAQFSTETAEGDFWIYASTFDGVTYTPAVRLDTPDWTGDGQANAVQWYSENGTGIGFNLDMPEWIEANVTDAGGEIMALGFKAPKAGSYEFTVTTLNAWGQNGGDVVLCLNGTEIGSVAFVDMPVGGVFTIDMQEGDILYIHGTSNGGWVSCYMQVAVNFED